MEPPDGSQPSTLWSGLHADLRERVFSFLNVNDIALGIRCVDKAYSKRFADCTLSRLSLPCAPASFAEHWTEERVSSLPVARRRLLIRLTAAAGVAENLELALRSAACSINGDVAASASAAGTLASIGPVLLRHAAPIGHAAWAAAGAAGRRDSCTWLRSVRASGSYGALTAAAAARDEALCRWLLAEVGPGCWSRHAVGAAAKAGHAGLVDLLLLLRPTRAQVEAAARDDSYSGERLTGETDGRQACRDKAEPGHGKGGSKGKAACAAGAEADADHVSLAGAGLHLIQCAAEGCDLATLQRLHWAYGGEAEGSDGDEGSEGGEGGEQGAADQADVEEEEEEEEEEGDQVEEGQAEQLDLKCLKSAIVACAEQRQAALDTAHAGGAGTSQGSSGSGGGAGGAGPPVRLGRVNTPDARAARAAVEAARDAAREAARVRALGQERVLSAAAGSSTPDWRDKVAWLEQVGYPRSNHTARWAASRPDGVERLRWFKGLGWQLTGMEMFKSAIVNGQTEVLRYLLSLGANLDRISLTWTDLALEKALLGVLQFLREREISHVSGPEAATVAARRGDLVTLRWVMANPLQPWRESDKQLLEPALWAAARAGSLGAVRFLVEEWGLDLGVHGVALVAAAAGSGDQELVEYLITEQRCPWSGSGHEYVMAAAAGAPGILRTLAAYGCPMQPRCGTPYLNAARLGDAATLRACQELGFGWPGAQQGLRVALLGRGERGAEGFGGLGDSAWVVWRWLEEEGGLAVALGKGAEHDTRPVVVRKLPPMPKVVAPPKPKPASDRHTARGGRQAQAQSQAGTDAIRGQAQGSGTDVHQQTALPGPPSPSVLSMLRQRWAEALARRRAAHA
ncbi:hypothetical protein HYH03_003629 [Edaphochlamys debaryana]|uniref:Uncharacterized protein n=1 Tax=Edaphochlamys debaryana TaxID=47281 RepID=A0A836C335_9CHLO|nr:hypothetical protein HYH03_003629 [Edaphochlamys debaryana]|eukprot:KAG2498370.1 hypothetical protein HYH03_003629 [Edaphochlamys debaryana]